MSYQCVTPLIVSLKSVDQLITHDGVFQPSPCASKKTNRLIAKLKRKKQLQLYGETVPYVRIDTEAMASALIGLPDVAKAIGNVFCYAGRAPQAVLVGVDVFRSLLNSPGADKYLAIIRENGEPVSISLGCINLAVHGRRLQFNNISIVVIPWMQGWLVL
ncbi:MAG: hypothetical protein ACRC02_07010 [Vogesella sp.]|uniref:hypothetical protein n=1 Tax=Vogesella sp. TaxID=1904252 RepID=UPI003F392170